MSVDNRTTLNDCSSNAGWTGDDSANPISTVGSSYEGGSALSTQLSNSDEHMYTTSIGGTRDLSDATVYDLIKDNLIDTQANGGGKIVLHDGTDRIGFEVGGNDAVGLSLPTFFNAYKLDVSNRAAFTGHVFAGSVANLTVTAITGVGYGSLHLAKAVGSIDNIIMDRFCFIANGTAALTVNGGTAITPETSSDVVADDITNGWGMVANPQGDQFNWFAPTEWGDSGTASSYFSVSDEQWYLLGQGVGVDNFNFALIGNTTGTNLFSLTNIVIVNLGARSNWDFSDVNFDEIKLEGFTFTDNGTFTFQAQDAGNKYLDTGTFNNCDQVYLDTLDVDNVTFNGSNDVNGALLIDENSVSNSTNLIFNSDGTGHAIHLRPTGAGPFTYSFSNWQFNNFATDAGTATDRAIYVDPVTSSADVTINILDGGSTPSIREAAGYTGTVTAVNTVAIKTTVLDATDSSKIEGARVLLEAAAGGDLTVGTDILSGLTDVNGVVEDTGFSYTNPQPVVGKVRKGSATPFYKESPISGTITSNGFETTIFLVSDE